MLLPGNCWCGAWLLRLRHGGRVRRCGRPRRWWRPRHRFCVLPDGEAWHFTRVFDVLPPPLNMLLFVGRFEPMARHPQPRPPQEPTLHANDP